MYINLANFLILISGITLVGVVFYLHQKEKRLHALENHIHTLEEINKELDRQTKLIIQTDLELKKTQENLDKKIFSLFTLHKISRLLITTLEEEEIIKKLHPSLILDLGFDKFLLILIKNNQWELKSVIGFTEESAQKFKEYLKEHSEWFLSLNSKEIISNNIAKEGKSEFEEFIFHTFKISSFIFLPLESVSGILGFCLYAKESPFEKFTSTDIEISKILTFQVARSIENARLFDKAWRNEQELDNKIKESTLKLQKALEEVEKINKRKTEFVSNVSHELRTPLTSVKGYASLLAQEKFGKLPQEAKEKILKINEQVNILVNMVNILLDIARIESGREEFAIQPYNLSELFEELKNLFTPQLKEKEIEFIIESPQEVNVLCDYEKMRRVFVNLIGNAIKFTPNKGKINLRAVEEQDKFRFEVEDTGIGIPVEERSHVFEEFYRTEKSVNQGIKGTGLGLPLVKKIIEAHNSEIWIEDGAGGKGTKFCFYLRKANHAT